MWCKFHSALLLRIVLIVKQQDLVFSVRTFFAESFKLLSNDKESLNVSLQFEISFYLVIESVLQFIVLLSQKIILLHLKESL